MPYMCSMLVLNLVELGIIVTELLQNVQTPGGVHTPENRLYF